MLSLAVSLFLPHRPMQCKAHAPTSWAGTLVHTIRFGVRKLDLLIVPCMVIQNRMGCAHKKHKTQHLCYYVYP